jgi:chromosome partitioning protein
MILVVGSVGGGTGKTTVATNLSVMRAQNCSDVLLVDADPQGSSADFVKVREMEGHSPELTCIPLLGQSADSELRILRESFNDIVVDVGGRDSLTLRSVLLVADVFVVPFLASHYDTWASEYLSTIIEQVKTLNENLKVISFLNKVETNHKIDLTSDAISAAKNLPNINLLNLVVSYRISFRRSVAEGLAVNEIKPKKDKKAILEMEQLYKEVFKNA